MDVATIGSTGGHGGIITTGGKTTAGGKKVARVGDTYSCPIHGAQTVTTGSSVFSDTGAQVAFVGCFTSCGDVILTGESCIQLDH
ncbi:PAAR domain-containing protein [Novispirillum itersonii]|uniref:PAAR domain-containing protein n=1 Tax=Novispirillum itersonii TaxID=189 RepID=UPI0009DC05A0